MQAIILAAGMGKRLGKLTHDNTKCMIKVHAQTLIERMIRQLATLSLHRIILVVGYKSDKVKTWVGNQINDTPILYVENPIYDKTNNIYSLYLAKDYLIEDETILLESDLIFADEILKKLVEHPYPNLAVVAKYQSWMDGTVVTLDEENNILNFISKKAFSFRDKDLYYKTVNIYKFSRDFSTNRYVPFLEAYSKALGNNEYYEQVLRVISLLDKPDLKAMPIHQEKWYEIDDIQDLHNAEDLFINDSQALSLYSKRFGGYWRFPMMVDFCYLVNPYFPSKRLKEEMMANFNTLLTQYPSGMQVNCQLAARYAGISAEQIIVGNGAAELIQAYLRRTDTLKTGIILPTFEEYPNRLEKERIVYYLPGRPDFSYSADDLISFYTQHPVDRLILINPDNPSGNFLSKTELLTLLEWSKENSVELVIDESFADFACAQPDQNVSLLDINLLNAYPHLVVIKSISKSYGVPGLRLGFLASGNTELIRVLKKEVSIWNINSFAEFYMQIFTKYQDDYKKACLKFVEERERFFHLLQTIPYIRVIPSAANYFLCEVEAPYTALGLCNRLLTEFNLLLKNCSTKAGFEGKQYIRIAIRNHEDNDRLLEALRQLNP